MQRGQNGTESVVSEWNECNSNNDKDKSLFCLAMFSTEVFYIKRFSLFSSEIIVFHTFWCSCVVVTFEPGQQLGHVATWPHRKLCFRPRCWPRWWRLEPGCNMARTWPQRDPNMTSSALAAFKRDQQVGHVCGHVQHAQTLSGHVPRPCSPWPETWPERDYKTSRYLYSVFV